MNEPARKISWIDIFIGLGLAFGLSNALIDRMPREYLMAISIVCFVMAIGFRVHGRTKTTEPVSHDHRP